jgi:hypothetical protein
VLKSREVLGRSEALEDRMVLKRREALESRGKLERKKKCAGEITSAGKKGGVRYHCRGWSEEVNSCILNSYMFYL